MHVGVNKSTPTRPQGHTNEPGIWRTVWSTALIALLLSYYLTGTLTFGYESKWFVPRYVWHRIVDPRPEQNVMSEEELRLHDGSDAHRAIYVAVDGMVFDVSSRPETYGISGAYHFFSGRDGARAFATGCFATDLTHDLRGLSEQELQAIAGWQQFYLNSNKYWLVGYVKHPPLTGPPPQHCRAAQKPDSTSTAAP